MIKAQKIKKIFYLVILAGLFSCGENKTNPETPAEDEGSTSNRALESEQQKIRKQIRNIEDIRCEHSHIISRVKNRSLDTTSFKYNCNGEKAGNVTFFYENGEMRLIRHTYNEYSHFSATDDYFIQNDSLFFVFQHHLAWSFTGQDQTQDKITERRFYVLNNKPVQCLEKKYTIKSDDDNPPESDKIANKEVQCAPFEDIFIDYELLFGLKERKGDMGCLEE